MAHGVEFWPIAGNAQDVAQAIPIAVSDQAMRERAADLGATIQVEGGIACAVEVVHQLM